jgi:hypothetical protein
MKPMTALIALICTLFRRSRMRREGPSNGPLSHYVMRPSLTSVAAVAFLAVAVAISWAIPPTICHESLHGVLFSSVSGAFTAPVRLSSVTVTSDEDGITLEGRYRCKRDAEHPERCTGSGTKARIDGQLASVQSATGIQYSMQVFTLHPGVSVRCELNASPAFFLSSGCIAGMVGTYTCHDASEQTDRGSFALVGSCRQCGAQ